MILTTNWGYSLASGMALPDIITPAEFDEYTAKKFSGDVRILSAIKAASTAVRNYCGWHIYPSMECTATEIMLYGDGRAKIIGNDIMFQLPSAFVSNINSVKINNVEHEEFEYDTNGILHIFDVDLNRINRKSKITVVFTSGIPASLMPSVKEIVAHRVTHALSSPNGVASESAGGVSISYNSNWVNSSNTSSLPDDDKEALSHFKLQGVF